MEHFNSTADIEDFAIEFTVGDFSCLYGKIDPDLLTVRVGDYDFRSINISWAWTCEL